MRRDRLMLALARHRAERSLRDRPEAVAISGYRGHAISLERWVGVVIWIAFLVFLLAESN